MLQSRVLFKQNTYKLELPIVDDLRGSRKEALARIAMVQEIDFSYQGIPSYDRVDYSERLSLILYAFRSLCKLDLSHSRLDELPKGIGFLLSLTHLFLNDNYLSSLQPIIIRRLVNLQELDLRNNKLNNFSLDITELSCLRRLSVQGNPLKDDETRKLMKLAHNERWIDIAGECKIHSRTLVKLWTTIQ